MCVLLIKRLLRLVGRWARKPVNHTSWVALVTPTDRPKSVRNRCLIELFCGVVCVVTLPFLHFCWCRGFCHRTESDLFLFLLRYKWEEWVVTRQHFVIFQKARKGLLLQSSIGCNGRSRNLCYINVWDQDFLTKLFTWFTHHIFSIIVKENQTSPAYILQKQVLCVMIRNTHTRTQ